MKSKYVYAHKRKGKQLNFFCGWVGERPKNYSSKERGLAVFIFLGLIIVSLMLTSGTRIYNYEHFIKGQGGFLPDDVHFQWLMFAVYAAFSLGAVMAAYAHKKRQQSNKSLFLGATLAAMGISAVAVLMLMFGIDFLTLSFYAHQQHWGMSLFVHVLNAYFREYGLLYAIPLILMLIAFGVKAFYAGFQDQTSGEQGTAAFATKSDLQHMGAYAKTDAEGVIFGKDQKGEFLRYPICNRTIISQTGGGKTSGVVIPALLTQNRPMFIHDLKGELWAVTARHRSQAFGHEIVAIDPYGITRTPEFLKGKPAFLTQKIYRFNPLDAIPKEEQKRDEALAALVKSLSARSGNRFGIKDNHFEDMAETLLLGLIEWVVMNYPTPNLIMVHDLLCTSKENLETLLTEMQVSDLLRAKAAGAQVLAAAHEERGSILTTTYRQLSWLADPNLRQLVSETNFDLKGLITGKADIYVIMPGAQAREQSRVFRMLLACVRNLMVQTPKSQISKEELLFLFDELGQLGYCEDIEAMLPIMRAYNAVFWSVFQDIGQIKKYGEMKGLFMGAKLMQFFGITDSETIRWICELGGRKTYLSTNHSESKGRGGAKNAGTSQNESVSNQESGADLIKFNEVREMPFDKQLVLIQGERPIECNKVFYFKEEAFKGKYDPNPLEEH